MSLWAFVVAAVLLSLERVCYVWAWRAPESFRAFCARPRVMALGDPVSVLQKLFFCFKGIQLAVFFGWCYLHGYGLLPSLMSRDFVVLTVGTAAIIAGHRCSRAGRPPRSGRAIPMGVRGPARPR